MYLFWFILKGTNNRAEWSKFLFLGGRGEGGGGGCFDYLKILAQFPFLEKGDRVKNSDIRSAVLYAYMQYKHFVNVKTQQSQK